MAEQLAARTLLSVLAKADAALAAVPVSDEQAERLKVEGPKNRLIEACAKSRTPAPVFEERPLVGGRGRTAQD